MNKRFVLNPSSLDKFGDEALIFFIVISTSRCKVSGRFPRWKRQRRLRNLWCERTCHDSVWYLTLNVLRGCLELLAILLLKDLHGGFETTVTLSHVCAPGPAQACHETVKHCAHDDYWHCHHSQKKVRVQDHKTTCSNCLCVCLTQRSFRPTVGIMGDQ